MKVERTVWRVEPITHMRLKEILSEHVCMTNEDGEETEVSDQVVAALLQRGKWDHIPVLDGIMDTPIMRDNGEIVAQTGYDRESRFMFMDEELLKQLEN